MLSHDDIWAALDRLARKRTMSPSGLAKEAGLDATTFNKSKRFTPAGKPRWPSTESIAKVLKTVNMSFEDFAVMAAHRGAQGPAIPVIGLAQAEMKAILMMLVFQLAVLGKMCAFPGFKMKMYMRFKSRAIPWTLSYDQATKSSSPPMQSVAAETALSLKPGRAKLWPKNYANVQQNR